MAPRLLTVIECYEREGTGKDTDPSRRIHQFWSLDGTLLMQRDEWREDELQRLLAEAKTVDQGNGALCAEFVRRVTRFSV